MNIQSWQQTQWQYLQKCQQQNRLPHALLLAGSQGLGKLNFAQLFAQNLLCETDDSCGHCRSCQLYQAETHPDFLLIQPAETGQMIKIDQIRELTEWANKTSQLGGYQIVIIEPAEAMNIAAMNALLKTLEEPTPRTVLMLVTHHALLLPATLRSRCQKLIFQTAYDQVLASWLNSDQRAQLIQCLRALHDRSLHPIQLAAQCAKFDLSVLLNGLIYWVVDLIRVKSGLQSLVNQEAADLLGKISGRHPLSRLFAYLDKLYDVKQLLLRKANFNTQLLLEDLFCDLEHFSC